MFDSLDVVRSVSPEIVVLNKARWMFHLSQIFTNEQKPFCIRLGSWCILSLTEFHRGTEAFLRTGRTHKRLQADDRYYRTLLLTWVERFCEFCMPEAFCEIETVRKKGLSNLWDLWEKYLPSESRNCSFSHRVHRWTEHTKVHRDIKSTDFTEPYSHLWQLRSVNSVCRRPSVGSKLCAKRVCQICEFCERKKLYEVCKQPNRGNLTYHAPPCGGGVGGGATSSWVRNSALKGSVKSVSSVREIPPQWVSQLFFFSQRNTDEQNTQSFTETLSQPISQNLTANIS